MSEYPLLLPFIIVDCRSNGGATAFLCTKPSNYAHYAVALSECMQNQ